MKHFLAFLKRVLAEVKLRRNFPDSVIHAGATADKSSVLGRRSVLFCNARLVESNLGAYSYVQESSVLFNVEVGPFCSIACNVSIGLVNHPTFMVSTSPVFYDSNQPLPTFFVRGNRHLQKLPRTVIEADVWIGDGVKIMAGVRIGVGAVIGAGAVVTRDVPPYTIEAGVPCRLIRSRFPEDICLRLLNTKWWELDDTQLAILAPYFVEPERFLSEVENVRAHQF